MHPARWRLTPGQTLRSRSWTDEVLVYNDLSGDTHLLTKEALLILSHLAAQPCDAAQLARLLGESAEAEWDTADLDEALAQLESLFLIESLSIESLSIEPRIC